MQKLQEKLKNAPRNASLVPCSVSSDLNKEEILSDQSIVRTCNNSEENLLQHTGGQILKLSVIVYVLSISGSPLMPTSSRGARKLIESGNAKVIKRFPFTIQMLVSTKEHKQKITLGIDSGYKNIGYSAITSKKELISGVVVLDTKTKERLSEKRMYRRGRRNKLWYREPRFNNRVKKSTWLAPSVERNYNVHLLLINKIKKILPITKINIEIGNFDVQKLNNPNINGKEYQQGNMYGFSNLKAFVMSREKGKCQFCGKEKGNDTWKLHHIVSRMVGSDSPDNMALLHFKCHIKIHKKNLEKSINSNRTYKEATFMNIIKNRFQRNLNCEITSGYITYSKRIELKLPKTHFNDAFVIANGTNQIRTIPTLVVQKRKNNRSVQLNRNGFIPSIRKQRYIHQPKDLVTVENKEYEVIGTFNCGKWIRVKNGNEIKPLNFSVKKIQKHYMHNSLVFQGKIL